MEQRKQLEQLLIEKAMKDPDFRKRLLENPKAVIEEEAGVKIPEGINVKVMEEDLGTVYLVLPFIHAESNDTELNEADLDMVSAGNMWTGVFTCIIDTC